MIYVYRLSDLTIREYLEDHNARVCKHLADDFNYVGSRHHY